MLADRYGCILFDLDGVLYRGRTRSPGAPHHGRAPATRRPPRLPDQQLLPDATPGGRQAAGDRDRGGPGRGRDLRARDRRAARERRGGTRVRDRPGRRSRGVDRRRHPDPRGRAGGGRPGRGRVRWRRHVRVAQARVAAGPARGASGRDERGRVVPGRRRAVAGCGRAPVSVITTTTGAEPEGSWQAVRTRCSRPVAGGGEAAGRSSWGTGSTRTSRGRRAWGGTRCSCSRASRAARTSRRTGIRPTVIAEDVSALLEDP